MMASSIHHELVLEKQWSSYLRVLILLLDPLDLFFLLSRIKSLIFVCCFSFCCDDGQDPREAILRHASEAASNPYWVSPAYNQTQPKPIFQKPEGIHEGPPFQFRTNVYWIVT